MNLLACSKNDYKSLRQLLEEKQLYRLIGALEDTKQPTSIKGLIIQGLANVLQIADLSMLGQVVMHYKVV